MKLRVLSGQVNHTYGKGAFLPYSSGLLIAYARKDENIREAYEFLPPLFRRDPIEEVVQRAGRVDVAALSCYIWNSNYTLVLAKALKEANPHCLVVLGGPHVPVRSEGFFRLHPYTDLLVHYEGEQTFREVLLTMLDNQGWNLTGRPPLSPWEGVKGLSLHCPDGSSFRTPDRERLHDLDEIPSPYLEGVFDWHLENFPDLDFHPTWEGTRGCPYSCTFCLSGNSIVNLNGYESCRIDQLSHGKKFMIDSYDPIAGVYCSTLATSAITGKGKRLVRVWLDDLSYLDCTPDHKFYAVHRGDTEAWDLQRGDELKTPQGKPSRRVSSVEILPDAHDVYCLNVPGVGWFFANGVLVHNCDWGSNTLAKLKKHSDSYLEAEIDWCGRNKLSLLYGADANTGILERDLKLAEFMVKTKEKYGYPQKFRAAYAKNNVDRVFEMNRILNRAGMSKGATLSFQSMDENTLDLIKRKNIGTEKYRTLMRKYREENIPTYSEIIIGLPGETYDTFADGLDSLLQSGCHEGLSVYTCELLPNSEMSFPEYQQKYGLKSVVSPVPFYHGTPSDDPHREVYEIVTATNSLPEPDWLRCQLLAWAVQAFHCLGPTQALAVIARHRDGISYQKFYEGLIRFGERNRHSFLGKLISQVRQHYLEMQTGAPPSSFVDPKFGNILWPPEEYACLQVAAYPSRFYESLPSWVGDPLSLNYQRRLTFTPLIGEVRDTLWSNLHEFVQGRLNGEETPWVEGEAEYTFTPVKHYTDLESFAREVVWFGRKGGGKRVEVKRVTAE